MTRELLFQLGSSVLLRHAEKVASEDDNPAAEVSLTKKGWSDSVELGRLLRSEKLAGNLQFFVSPRERCIETAKGILEGAGLSQSCISTSQFLGSPGPFVTDTRVGREVFDSIGTERVVGRYLRGDQQGCFRPLVEGCESLLEFITSSANSNSVSFFISHDAIIIPFIWWMMSVDISTSWIPPLGGLALNESQYELLSDPLEVFASQS